MPGFGIVAAVLGVVITMGAIGGAELLEDRPSHRTGVAQPSEGPVVEEVNGIAAQHA